MSNLMDMLCRVRDILTTKDFIQIKINLYTINRLAEEIKRQVKNHGPEELNKLDFNSYDLKELSEEIMEVIKVCEKKINVANMLKGLYSKDKINNAIIEEFTNISANYMAIRSCLTPIHSMVVFLGVLLNLFEEQAEQGKIDNVLAEAIRGML